MKTLFKKALRHFGYEVRRARPPESRWTPESLRRGVPPVGTCFDVGVGAGTPVLYQAFPEAYHVLLEPLREFEPDLEGIVSRYRGAYFLTAVGAREGTRTLSVDRDVLLKSTFLNRTALTRSSGRTEPREVPVTTLDRIVASRSFEAPFGLKIDTEGFELDVLRGAEEFLERTAFVIAEVSYARRFEGGYSFSELADHMGRRGFYIHEILEAAGTPVLYFDALFLKTAST